MLNKKEEDALSLAVQALESACNPDDPEISECIDILLKLKNKSMKE